MTAYRVVDNHEELGNAGSLSHPDIDAYLTSTAFLVASGSAPGSGRKLVLGEGLSYVDHGPGGEFTVRAAHVVSWNEVPIGQNDGVNRVFELRYVPDPPTALMLFVNGVKQAAGEGCDYVLNGNVIEFNAGVAYTSGSNIDATYQHA